MNANPSQKQKNIIWIWAHHSMAEYATHKQIPSIQKLPKRESHEYILNEILVSKYHMIR